MTPVAVRLPPDVEQRLRSLAERSGRSKASLEDLEDEELALERPRNPDQRWTLDELERGFDLERAGRACQDHPFACFDEWSSDVDTEGYASL